MTQAATMITMRPSTKRVMRRAMMMAIVVVNQSMKRSKMKIMIGNNKKTKNILQI